MQLNIKRHDMPEPCPVEVVETRVINGRHFFAYENEEGNYVITDTRTGALLCDGSFLPMAWEVADFYAVMVDYKTWDAKHPQINEIPCT